MPLSLDATDEPSQAVPRADEFGGTETALRTHQMQMAARYRRPHPSTAPRIDELGGAETGIDAGSLDAGA